MTTDARAIELARPEIDGLTLRNYRLGDAEPMADLFNRVFEHDDVPWRTDPEEQANWLSTPNEHFDSARDVFIVLQQSRRTFVEKVDFITSAGYLDGGVHMRDTHWKRIPPTVSARC